MFFLVAAALSSGDLPTSLSASAISFSDMACLL